LILRNGYNHTGLNEILAEAGVPKGSFYYYFNSKEDFGLQVLDEFAARTEARITGFLADTSQPPLARLRAYFEWYANYWESLDSSLGCMLGNLGQELADQNEAFRLKVEATMAVRSEDIARCLRAAQQAGQIDAALDVQELAAFCFNSWEGAILRMKVAKSTAPLHTFIHTLFDGILKA
jgi:TetR/AcrR family transcriptional repressor of nem operon